MIKDDIIDIVTLYCPVCEFQVEETEYEFHVGSCNSKLNPESFACEICEVIIDDDFTITKYITHLLKYHEIEEINKRVKNRNILSMLELEGVDEIHTTFMDSNLNNNDNIDNMNLEMDLGSVNNNLTKEKYKVAQCDLCQNLVKITIYENSVSRRHLENYHRFSIGSQAKGTFNTKLEIKSIDQLHLCETCDVYMNPDQNVIQIHRKMHLNKKEDSIDYNNNYECSICSVKFSEDQFKEPCHISFLTFKAQTVNNNWSLSGNTNSFNIHSNNNISYWGNNNQNENDPLNYLLHKKFYPNHKQKGILPFYDDDIELDNLLTSPTFLKNPNVELTIKEWELFSSLSRTLPDKIDEEFNSIFLGKMFDYVDFMSKSSNIHYFYKEEKGSTANLLKRLNTEFSKLSENLPCNFSSSYFIRADSNSPQFVKVLIAGSRGTPYEHGLFEFDIYLPTNYPVGIPKCVLRTTGNNNIRFNPNLYENGKVCLSLLGTWSGKSNEMWDPNHSSLTQLLLSLSSLVMNDKIIENEPGYEKHLYSVKGIEQNEGYANIVRYGNISYAMINMIQNPSEIFAPLVKEYFEFKNKELLEDINIWITRIGNVKCEYQGLAFSHNFKISQELAIEGYEFKMKKKMEELVNLLKQN